MPQIQVNGTVLYYEAYGHGDAIVFIHGSISTHRIFEPQLEYFRKRSSVIVVDVRGSGQSGKLGVEVNQIANTQCDDLKKLLTLLNVSKVTLVGYADGGLLALQFANQYADYVQALVLVDCYLRSDSARKRNKLWDMYTICSGSCYYLPSLVRIGRFFMSPGEANRIGYATVILPAGSILRYR